MTLTCELSPCPEHGVNCAYHGDEPGRCAWCHGTWDYIIQSGHHTCELAKSWPTPQRKWRVLAAVQARAEASEASCAVDTATFCPHVESGSTEAP